MYLRQKLERFSLQLGGKSPAMRELRCVDLVVHGRRDLACFVESLL